MRLRGVAALLFAVSSAGCGVVGGGSDTVFQHEVLRIQSSPDANNFSPTAVDMVFVYDPGVIDLLQGLPAADWFARRRQFLLDFPDGLAVESWEIVPNTAPILWEVPAEMFENEEGDDAVTAFIYADYLSPGEHRARLETRIGTRVDLGPDTFTPSAYVPDN
jgi:type VI secretion system protein